MTFHPHIVQPLSGHFSYISSEILTSNSTWTQPIWHNLVTISITVNFKCHCQNISSWSIHKNKKNNETLASLGANVAVRGGSALGSETWATNLILKKGLTLDLSDLWGFFLYINVSITGRPLFSHDSGNRFVVIYNDCTKIASTESVQSRRLQVVRVGFSIRGM